MSWTRAAVASLFVVPIVLLFAFGLSRDPRVLTSSLPGRMAPDFELVRMKMGPNAVDGADGIAAGSVGSAGDTVRLSELRGQVVVLNFWASWCPPCRTEHPALSAAAHDYADDGVRFLGVLYQDRPAAARRWLEEMGAQSYPTLLDPGARTAIAYGLAGVPETVFIGRDGRVAYKQIGPVTRELLTERIEALLSLPRASETGP